MASQYQVAPTRAFRLDSRQPGFPRPRYLRRALALLLLALSSLSVAASPNLFAGAIEHAHPIGTFALDGEVFHVQGLALEPGRIWLTSVDRTHHKGYLHLFDRTTGKLIRRLDLTDGDRYHAGGIALSGGSLWVPLAENRPHSTAVLIEIDTRTLQVRRHIAVADHIGCVAVNGRTLVAGNWDSERLYILDLTGQAPPRTVANPTPTHFQDLKFVGDRLVGSGTLSLWSGALDWLDWPSLKPVRSLRAGAFGPLKPFGSGGPYTAEGMAIEGRELYLLPEDGPSRLFHFRLDRPA